MATEPLAGRVAVVTGAAGRLGPVWREALERAGATRRGHRPAGRRGDRGGRRDRPRGRRRGARAIVAAPRHADACSSTTPASTSRRTPRRRPGDRGRPARRLPAHARRQPGRRVQRRRRCSAPRWPRPAAARSSTSARSTRRSRPSRASTTTCPGFLKPAGLRRLEGRRRAPDALLRAPLGPARRARQRALAGRRARAARTTQFLAKYTARVPLGRMAAPSDLGGPLVFLASDASRYVTGHELRVDGGFTGVSAAARIDNVIGGEERAAASRRDAREARAGDRRAAVARSPARDAARRRRGGDGRRRRPAGVGARDARRARRDAAPDRPAARARRRADRRDRRRRDRQVAEGRARRDRRRDRDGLLRRRRGPPPVRQDDRRPPCPTGRR